MTRCSPAELGVIGWPLEYTLSPDMHNAALVASGLGYRYERIPVAPSEVNLFVQKAQRHMLGFNVTIPHKHTLFRLCSETDELSRASGACNTVVFDEQRILGYNTDGPGLMLALDERTQFVSDGSKVLLIGAGGAARGCLAQLIQSGAQSVTLVNRDLTRAAELVAEMQPLLSGIHIEVCDFKSLRHADRLQLTREPEYDIVLNCIPADAAASLWPVVSLLAGRNTVLCDLSYSAKTTFLSARWREAGLPVVYGLDVLLWQAVRAYEIFTKKCAPVAVMRGALTDKCGKWW